MGIPILVQQLTLAELAQLHALSRGERLPGGFLSPLAPPSRPASPRPAGSAVSSSTSIDTSPHTRSGSKQSSSRWNA